MDPRSNQHQLSSPHTLYRSSSHKRKVSFIPLRLLSPHDPLRWVRAEALFSISTERSPSQLHDHLLYEAPPSTKRQTNEAFEVWDEKVAEEASLRPQPKARDPELAFEW